MKNLPGFLLLLCMFSPATLLVAGEVKQPIARVHIEPLDFSIHTGVNVRLELREGTGEYSFIYRWFLNGEENYFQTTPVFPGSLLQRGDKLSVEIIPVDLNDNRLKPVVIHDMVVGNASPVIISDPSAILSVAGYSYKVTATDPDGDTLTFNLEEAPEGMEIDPATGQIIWQFDTMPQGVFPVKIIVEDGFEGRAEQTFELNLSLVNKETTQ